MLNHYQHYSVHKFGGSSLKNAQRFRALSTILPHHHEIIVVSAVQGTTSLLQDLLNAAQAGEDFVDNLQALKLNHLNLIKELLLPQEQAKIAARLNLDFSNLKNILTAIKLTNVYSHEISDFVLGFGEKWSAEILFTYLSRDHQVKYIDAAQVLFIYKENNVVCVDWEKSSAALQKALANQQFEHIIISGYIASTLTGVRTTLGRNGSDFSAAIFAKLFNACELLIWTDVDGIYSADPRKVKNALIINELSYNEALELAYFGAKVLHPQSIGPAKENNIPIIIKNSFNPLSKGTLISAHPTTSSTLVKGMTYIDDVALINIEGSGMIGVSGVAAKVFKILEAASISVIFISQACSEHSICLVIANQDAEIAILTLQKHLQFELIHKQIEAIAIDKNCSILAIVGDNMRGQPGISGKLCDALAKANINIRAISQGSSERNISIVLDKQNLNRALQALHASFYLSHKIISIGLIGPGQVGKTLLMQIHEASTLLRDQYQLILSVRGIMDSQKMLLGNHSINLTTWHQQLSQSQLQSNINRFCDHLISNDEPHAVIIDCTANQQIANQYHNFIDNGLHIITPNKHANAGEFSFYHELKNKIQKNNKHYFYEATVCAGLPVINTLQDMIKTGDRIIKIEGIVSGTLSYIFNEVATGRRFSDVVLEAKQLGYTEPDPREDLSGMDVARKLVCLAREIGHKVSLGDVKVHNLIPDSLRSCSKETFMDQLHTLNDAMEHYINHANVANLRLFYIGSISAEGVIKVSIESLPLEHPFASLSKTDNMIIFYTKRYFDQPLIIKGPGAGAQVTSAGIFSDLLRLSANLN